MDDEKEEQKRDESLFSKIKAGVKKANKSKFVMTLRKAIAVIGALPLIFKIVTIIAVICVISVVIHIFQIEGTNNVFNVASSDVIKENTTIEEADDGKGYYFKIDKEIVDKYLKELNEAYYYGYYDEIEPDIDEDTEEYVYDKENLFITEKDLQNWFQTEDYEPYLIKMIRAQIASSYPKLGDYEGEEGNRRKL